MQRGYISTKEAADIVGRSPRTVIYWLETGIIPGFKLGGQWEVSLEGLMRYIKDQMEK